MSRVRNRRCLPNSQRCIPYAKEADLADRKMISYTTAVDRTFNRREAFALARPYSALVVGRGTSFLYRDGVLCYLSRKMIRILDVHDAAGEENVIDLDAMGRWWWPQVNPLSHVELLHYRAGFLSFLYHSETPSRPVRRERWLVVIDVRSHDPVVRLTVIMERPRIWVRNNDRYLYIGSHDGHDADGHRQWIVQGFDLHKCKALPLLPLPGFWGSDLRETIVFEIFDGCLHAVSNRSSFEMEEIDWTSFYWCMRFPVDEPFPERLQRKRIWRRQHVEGPINDSWTDLGLHRDERTGELLIVEARKEWKDGVGAQKRTFYIEPLDFSGCSTGDETTWETRSQSMSSPDHSTSPDPWDSLDHLPARPRSPTPPRTPFPDEPITKLIQKGDNPLYAPPRPRLHRQSYPECSGSEPASDEFPISRTRYRTFLPASSAFLDVVLDEYPLRAPGSPHPPRRAQQQIRLRIGSRVRASPLVPDPLDPEKRLLRPRKLDYADGQPLPNEADGQPLPESEDRFVDRGIRLWPPANAPTELVELLNPGCAWVGDVSVVEDERSLAYRVAPSTSVAGAEQNIVLVNFDRGVRHPWLPLLRWTGTEELLPPNVPAVTLSGKSSERRERGVGIPAGHRDRVAGSGSAEPGSATTEPRAKAGVEAGTEARGGAERRWWRRERAMHVDIQKGYRFD